MKPADPTPAFEDEKFNPEHNEDGVPSTETEALRQFDALLIKKTMRKVCAHGGT